MDSSNKCVEMLEYYSKKKYICSYVPFVEEKKLPLHFEFPSYVLTPPSNSLNL